MRTATTALIGLMLALTGCIALPDEPQREDTRKDTKTDAPRDRIDGMTAEVTYEDKVETCDGGGIQVPPGTVCATRTLDAIGRIGLDRLPVDLSNVNGAITISRSAGDAWSFHAVIKVRALTEESARAGLNTTWQWSYGEPGDHELTASPTPNARGPQDVQGLGAALESAVYVVTLPSWLVLDVATQSTNGQLLVDGFAMEGLRAKTTNGAVVATGSAVDVDVATTNGAVTLSLEPSATGEWKVETTNGAVTVDVVEDARHGYDVGATTQNGRIHIALQDGKLDQGRDTPGSGRSASFQTHGLDGREIRTTMALRTTNGAIAVTP